MTNHTRAAIRAHIRESIRLAQQMLADEFVDLIAAVAAEISGAYRRGNKVILFGNGGSAADAQHLAAEFVGRYQLDRQALSAIALSVNASSLTAIANDYGFHRIFARQIEATGVAGDVAVGISTSGKSPNVIHALRTARAKGLITVGLTGRDDGEMKKVVDYCLSVPSDSTPNIQEVHRIIGHTFCALVEREFADTMPEKVEGVRRR